MPAVRRPGPFIGTSGLLFRIRWLPDCTCRPARPVSVPPRVCAVRHVRVAGVMEVNEGIGNDMSKGKKADRESVFCIHVVGNGDKYCILATEMRLHSNC